MQLDSSACAACGMGSPSHSQAHGMLYIHTLLHICRVRCDADIQAQLYSYLQLYAYQRLYTYMQPYALQQGAGWGMGPALHYWQHGQHANGLHMGRCARGGTSSRWVAGQRQLGSCGWAAAAGQLGWAACMWGIAHLHLPTERQSWTTSTAWRPGVGIHGWTVIHVDNCRRVQRLPVWGRPSVYSATSTTLHA
jgi:hypothetical protein